MHNNLKSSYDALVASGQLRKDPAQVQVIGELTVLQDVLQTPLKQRRGLLAGLFHHKTTEPVRGLYLYGGVGVGKSMLMDLFFATTEIDRKRRVHFHAFMQETHAALHAQRKQGAPDPLLTVAKAVAASARLLCFDEMQITDITDAMLVGRLFDILMSEGVTLVITSNRPPDELYLNGLNRQLFLPFIAKLKNNLTLHHLMTDTDYRQNRLRGQQTYFTPNDADATTEIDRIWANLTDGIEEPLTIRINTRTLTLSRTHNGVARTSFADLCERPLGAGDYLALTKIVRLLILEGIPVMTPTNSDEAKRFVILIDTLYEAHTRLVCSAAVAPEKLFASGTGAFAFKRAASRLREMQSADWANSA